MFFFEINVVLKGLAHIFNGFAIQHHQLSGTGVKISFIMCCKYSQVLLSNDEVLQLSAVQCIEEVLYHHMDYSLVLLRADLAGIPISLE